MNTYFHIRVSDLSRNKRLNSLPMDLFEAAKNLSVVGKDNFYLLRIGQMLEGKKKLKRNLCPDLSYCNLTRLQRNQLPPNLSTIRSFACP